ncbi:ROK family transcriptional regulator [Streptomyces sp. TRM68416]|uniref:ROK family transcriptional regulator n=1 Tax=Streptomyces sp. TRM68416 TaxID=2758412 RepID=UPI001661F3B9|nr:ROK family transcriptional regulator [Streptomyces sp. TRM68416]MBD0841733.1 ROK family transcriptional regulator [Streptomyces sp. TRM68416]
MPPESRAPMRHAGMRERNLAVLLGVIAANQPVTRARLATLTGFTKTTVSNLIAVLAEAGLVHDGDMLHEGDRGRPGIGVSVNGAGAAGLGLEVNVGYLAAAVLDLGRRVRYRLLVAADNRNRDPAEIAVALARLAGQAVDSAAEQGLPVIGATVALPGLIDRSGMFRAPNFPWDDVPAEAFTDLGLSGLKLPTRAENEANLAALGELWFGAGRADLGDFVHVSGEIGIGAGVVLDGRVFQGAHGYAGELGHLQVDPDGESCPCGARGCLERIAGRDAVLHAAGLGDMLAEHALTGPMEPLSALTALLDSGDPAATEAVRRAGDALGRALSDVVKVIDPDTIVLGGIFSTIAPWILRSVEEALRAGGLYGQVPTVVVSSLGEHAAVLGAAGQIIEHLYADPALLLR